MRVRPVLTVIAVTFTLCSSCLFAKISITVTNFEVGIPYLDAIGVEETPCSADNFSRRIDWNDGAGLKPYKSEAKAVDCGHGISCVRPGKYAVFNQEYSNGQPHVYMSQGTFTAKAELTVHCTDATWTAKDQTSAEVHVFERHPVNKLTATITSKRGGTLKGQVTLTAQAEGLGTTIDFTVNKRGVFEQFKDSNTLRLYRMVPPGHHEGNFTLTVMARASLGPVILKAKTVGKEQQVTVKIVP